MNTEYRICNTDMNLDIFKKDMIVYIPKKYLNTDNSISKKLFKCNKVPPISDVSTNTLPIKWKYLPTKCRYIIISIIDTTCSYGCNENCKFTHWKSKIPITRKKNNNYDDSTFYRNSKGKISGIRLNGIRNLDQFNLKNSANLKNYIPFCAPNFQIHAHIISIIAFDKYNNVLAKGQSKPFLI